MFVMTEKGVWDFFYMYGYFFIDSHACLPFDNFTMGVLRVLNVAC